jgi:hypothetical protein
MWLTVIRPIELGSRQEVPLSREGVIIDGPRTHPDYLSLRQPPNENFGFWTGWPTLRRMRSARVVMV